MMEGAGMFEWATVIVTVLAALEAFVIRMVMLWGKAQKQGLVAVAEELQNARKGCIFPQDLGVNTTLPAMQAGAEVVKQALQQNRGNNTVAVVEAIHDAAMIAKDEPEKRESKAKKFGKLIGRALLLGVARKVGL